MSRKIIGVTVGTPMNPQAVVDKSLADWAKQPDKPVYTAEEVGALPNTTKIPSKTSELTNDSGFLTQHQSLADYAKKTELPTKTSQLTNDSGFLTSVPSEYITETELTAKGYLTQHQDLSAYAKKTDIPSVPTKTSQLTNDSGFLTSVPTEYVTETELNAKGYLTQHQDLSAYAKTSQIPTKVSQLTNDKNYLTAVPSEYVTDSELTAKGYASQTDVTNLSKEIANYLPKNQGAGNVGKILMVGTDGNLVLTDMPETGVSGDVVGVIDESNNILLSGNIADGTYTLAFENEDGTYTGSGSLVVSKVLKLVSISATKTKTTYTVGDTLNTNDITVTATYDDGSTARITDYTVNSSAVQMGTAGNYNLTISYGGKITTVAITVEAVPEPTYTNLADTTSADWKTGYRLDGSGALKQDSSITNLATTNFIACKNGDVIRIKGLTLGGTGQRTAVYTSNKANYSAALPVFPQSNSVWQTEQEGDVYKFTIVYASTAYIRFSGVLTGTSANVIITKNEAIS